MAKSEISSNKSSINCSFRKDKIVKKLKVELKKKCPTSDFIVIAK